MSKRVRLKTSGKGSLGAAAAEHAHALMTAASSNKTANRTSGNIALARFLAEEAQIRAAEQLARSKAHKDGADGGQGGGGGGEGGGGEGGGGGGGGFADSAAPKGGRDSDGADRGGEGEEREGSTGGAGNEKGAQEQGGNEGKGDAAELSHKKRRRKGKSNSTESTPVPGSKESREAWKLAKDLARAKRQEKGMNYDPDAFWLAAEWTGDLLTRSRHFHPRGYEDGFDMVCKVHV